MQDALTVKVVTFRRVGIETNLKNKKAPVYTPGYIWVNWVKAAYNRRATG